MSVEERLSHLPPETTAQFFQVLAALEREEKEKRRIACWLKESERVDFGRIRMTNLDREMEAHLDKKTKKRIEKLLKESNEEEAAKDAKKFPTESKVKLIRKVEQATAGSSRTVSQEVPTESKVIKKDDKAAAESSKTVNKEAPAPKKSRARKQKFPRRIPPTDEDM